MKIPATSKIALVGSSGCGKSTITNLLLRFYNLNHGKILIDGDDITQYNVENLRREIGFVM
jgi:ABC-type multidrug transport system fused ATPase/permease subunit